MDREPARSFEELIVWQKAHAFVLEDLGYTADTTLARNADEIGRLLRAYAWQDDTR